MSGPFSIKGTSSEAKDLAYCMFRNTLITLGMVGISLSSVFKNKQYKPLFYFTAIAFSGDMVNGYCVACRKEVKHLIEGRSVHLSKLEQNMDQEGHDQEGNFKEASPAAAADKDKPFV